MKKTSLSGPAIFMYSVIALTAVAAVCFARRRVGREKSAAKESASI